VTEVEGLVEMGQLVARMHAHAEAADAAEGGGAATMEFEPRVTAGEAGRRRLGAETVPEAPPTLD
jgi:hypothetical protein